MPKQNTNLFLKKVGLSVVQTALSKKVFIYYNYNSISPLNTSCHGRPCLLSCSMKGSGSNSSTL